MIFIERHHLPVVTTDAELEEVGPALLEALLLELPAHIVYFETPERLYGIVSFGDIRHAGDGPVRVNREFLSLGRGEYMRAREHFRNGSIREIPVVEGGRLAGEFSRDDDLLFLSHAPDIRRNAFAAGYLAGLHGVALVRPAEAREHKQAPFDAMRQTLASCGAGFEVVSLAEAIERFDDFDRILVVDEQERRGMATIVMLLRRLASSRAKIATYLKLRALLESSEVMDYDAALGGLMDKGIEVVLVTADEPASAYARRTAREMRERYPKVDGDLNMLMRAYDEAFFDDLYVDADYVRSIETGYFSVEHDRRSLRLRDVESPYVNVSHGERRTIGQPDEYDRTVFFYGPCLMIGAYVRDEDTIESHLQRILNESGQRVRVVNCGCWGGNVATIGRMATTRAKEGDVMVALIEDESVRPGGARVLDLWDVLERHDVPSGWMLDMPHHANHHVSRIYAEELYQLLFGPGGVGEPAGRAPVSLDLDLVDELFVRKYFHGVDLDRNGSVACLAINGNPFTNGHRHLVEVASRECEHVYVLSIMEDISIFSFAERFAMAVDAVAHLANVEVVPSGIFVGNSANFPAYYAKMYMGDTAEQARTHVEGFASVASALRVTRRYVGEEPHDPISNEINRACKEILPRFGIETVVLGRWEEDGIMVTGSLVRGLAEADDPLMERYAPQTTVDIIRGVSGGSIEPVGE